MQVQVHIVPGAVIVPVDTVGPGKPAAEAVSAAAVVVAAMHHMTRASWVYHTEAEQHSPLAEA